jgi:hypothetical protein
MVVPWREASINGIDDNRHGQNEREYQPNFDPQRHGEIAVMASAE